MTEQSTASQAFERTRCWSKTKKVSPSEFRIVSVMCPLSWGADMERRVSSLNCMLPTGAKNTPPRPDDVPWEKIPHGHSRPFGDVMIHLLSRELERI
jgi:hypothetical protein